MTRERKVQILTAVVLCGALAVVVARRQVAEAPKSQAPQDAIYAMLDAAREGRSREYLDAYGEPMRTSLEQAFREMGEARFVSYLKDSSAAIKGVAIQEPQAETDREVKARVEYVYQDRNEVQVVYLERMGTAWRIVRVEAAQRVKTLVPYGTPVQ